MRIASVAGAFPKNYFSQEVLVSALKQYWGDRLKKPEVLDKLHANVSVKGRYMSMPLEGYYGLSTWGEANDTWIQTGLEIGEEAITSALKPIGLPARELDAIYVVSVTGIASPSLDARLINRLGLCPNIKRNPIFGLGCVAGAAGIARAADYVRAFPGQTAVLLAVELCSLTIQRDDLSMANLISAGLFGDGAAAVIITGDERDFQGPEIIATRSTFYPDTERTMGWEISEKGFQIVLSPGVPDVVKQNLGRDVKQFLSDLGLTREDISSWVFHTGGPKVLEAVEDALDLKNDELAASWDSLAKVGNLSSVSVLLVLEDVMANRRPEPGSYGILGAMGPGFCSELILLKW
jgi:alkylresorcinol/alkylpyrone synthase